ncbi:hypothetical protein WME97_10180 [Sorangium sp. So ce367]|uniref:hypothetical protein n=1 Tax=Sorangium sp. So ce367 TaxID=3133305 RepID=UPI003F61CC97
MSNLIIPQTPAASLTTSVASLARPVADFLAYHDLPTENVLNPVDERKTVIDAFENAISVLPKAEREKAYYLSKFVVAISVGIFDAALSYLWDETILALRRLVEQTDLPYFFDVAEKSPSRRSRLITAEDLPRIDDAVLIETCVRIGLLTGVNGERLRHINFMRNHASAAHPNVAELNGAEMVGWLSNCLRHAITAKPDPAALQMHHFLVTVRERAIEPADVTLHEQELRKMQADRVDDLLWTLFGMYADPNLAAQARTNIDRLAPIVWKLASDQRKFNVGVRHAEYARRSDVPRRDLAMAFLKNVGGEAYRATDILTADLIEKIRALRAAHNGQRNFYEEAAPAAALEESLPRNGVVPKPVLYDWVSIVAQCYIGNGLGYYEGVDRGALVFYEKYIERFGEREIVEFFAGDGRPGFRGRPDAAESPVASVDPREDTSRQSTGYLYSAGARSHHQDQS